VISPARELAFRVLRRVQQGGYASDLLRRYSAGLDPRDARLAEAIVMGCLRFQAQLDFLILHFGARPLSALDQHVRIALRMGIWQLRWMDRVPRHAAVGESVELVKRAGKRPAAGLVNAVLRKVTRDPVPSPGQATGLSMPAWLLERWQRHYGVRAAEGIARAALEEPRPAVNPVTGRQQDIASRSIVPLLEIQPGMSVLDVCAAPGNKTAQILAAGGSVVACDRCLRRLSEVPAAASRVVLDASHALPFSARFDRILVDAPCSGTGTLARNPEIKWRLRPAGLARFQALQRRILANARAMLKPGGRLVYATCSLEPEENEDVVEGCPVLATRMWLPGRDPGDGFFAAVVASG
jgi:16S rRNA (cytosine967-C5)-methyltransferase